MQATSQQELSADARDIFRLLSTPADRYLRFDLKGWTLISDGTELMFFHGTPIGELISAGLIAEDNSLRKPGETYTQYWRLAEVTA